jgi:hypothetical protein
MRDRAASFLLGLLVLAGALVARDGEPGPASWLLTVGTTALVAGLGLAGAALLFDRFAGDPGPRR